MDDVIILSSDSDRDDSDVEIIGSFSNVMTKADPLPLTAVRVDVNAVRVHIPKLYINLTDPRWTPPGLKVHKRQSSTAMTVDLTETDVANGTKQEMMNLPPDVSQMKEEHTKENQTLNKEDCDLRQTFSTDQTVCALQRDSGKLKPKQICLDSQTCHQKPADDAQLRIAIVKLTRLPFLETDVTGCSGNLRRTTASNGPHMDPPPDKSPPKVVELLVRQEEQENNDEFTSTPLNVQHLQSCSDKEGSVGTSKERSSHEAQSSSSQDKAQGSPQKEVICAKLEQLELNKAESRQSCRSDHSCPPSPTTGPNPSEPLDLDSLSHTGPISHNPMSHVNPPPTLEPMQSEDAKADEASNSSDNLHWSIPSEPALSNVDMDDRSESGTYRGNLGIESPVCFLWQEGSNGNEVNKDSRFDLNFRAARSEDRQYVCPVTLKKIMSGSTQAPHDEEGVGTPVVLCRQSLSLVYSTIDESYTEGTLQLLSDLLQPGYYPPRDITSHLLRGILLNPQCPHHLCVQAFNLLMRAQRYHMADKTTVPWDWELLTSVVANQDHTKKHPCEVVRLLLDYVVQTLEDDFQAKRSISALHQSIAKATLSCDQHFPRVREVIKWLFSAITKSTEHGESREAARERDEQIRMVSIFQRMLSLALEVDRSPALTSAKLSQELFHMLIGNVCLRAHRMLLLESLQSKLLRCKLLEHLLDYACPPKIRLPMSLSLLLHFLKHCTLAPDPSDGTERWQRWEELVHLLWMLLLSYNNAMKGYLYNSISDQRGRAPNFVYRPGDIISKPAIREAVEAFLSRAQADLGQALPLHVEESLTYLQDHLLDVCQC